MYKTSAGQVRASRLLALLPALILVVPVQAGAGDPATGAATTDNVILSVQVGDRDVSVASDRAESELAASRRAYARFIAGTTGKTKFGSAERTATKTSEAGRDDVQLGVLGVDDLLELTVADAGVEVDVASDTVSSQAFSKLADVRALGGTFSFDGLSSVSATEVGPQAAVSSRSVTLDGVSLMRVGPLLDQLGIDPHSLACTAVEEAGAALGANTSQACEELSAAERAIDATGATLAAADDTLEDITRDVGREQTQAHRDSATALLCDATDVVCVVAALEQLVEYATQYGIELSDPTNLDTTRTEVVAGLDRILAAFEDGVLVDDAMAESAHGTCDAAARAIADVLATVTEEDAAALTSTLPPVAADLEASCGALRAALDALLGASLLSFDGVTIEMNATARAGDPRASVAASIGSLRVGLNDPVEVDVHDAEAIAEGAGSEIEEFFARLGIGFESPTLELLVSESDAGRDGEAWFAGASLTTLRLTVPSSSLDLPDDEPLGVLDDGGAGFGAAGFGVLGAPRAGVLAAMATGPEVVVEAARFSVGSSYTPPSVGGGDPSGSNDDPSGSNDDPSGSDGDPLGSDRDPSGSGDPAADDDDPQRTLPRTGSDPWRLLAGGLLAVMIGLLARRVATLHA